MARLMAEFEFDYCARIPDMVFTLLVWIIDGYASSDRINTIINTICILIN